MPKKSIWLINQYLCTPELNGDGHRHSFLAEEFIKKGYDVTLITSSFSHVPYRENQISGFYKVIDNNIRTLLIKGNKYKSTQGLSRALSWLLFCFLLFFIPTKKIPRPDIIIVSSNSLLPILNVVFYFKKKFNGVKFVLEIRDIWPLSLVEIGGFSTKNPIILFFAWVEKLGYLKADYIVSLLKDCNQHIEQIIPNKPFKYEWISNGYQLEDNSYYKDMEVLSMDKIPSNKFVIGYAGSLGKANAMEYIIDMMKRPAFKNVSLCILGNGDEGENLMKRSDKVENIIFLNRVPKNEVMSFLKKCDLLYFSSKKSILYSFGISANKTFDYMYAEKPIVLSASTISNVVEQAKCGYVVLPENIDALEKVILYFKNMDIESRNKYGLNGKKYLLEHLTYNKLAEKYCKIFTELS